MSKSNGDLQPHPFAELLPMMGEADYAALKADVLRAQAFTDPAVLYQGKLLDGRNRLRVSIETGIALPTITAKAKTDAEALAFVYSKAVHRNMTESQKAAAAVSMLPHFEKLALFRMESGGCGNISTGSDNGRARDQVGELFGVSGRYVADARAVFERDKKIFRQVFEGRMTLPQAKRQTQRAAKAKQWKKAAEEAGPVQFDEKSCGILVGDCRKVMEQIRDNSIDLVFTDPPYGIGEKYNGFDDNLSRDQLMEIVAGCITRLPRVLKPNASVFVMMSSRYAEDVGALLRANGLHRQEMIIWAESFGSHNPHSWTDCYRVIHHYTVHPTDFTFHHDDTRIYVPSWRSENGDPRADGDGKLPGNVWGAWTDRKLARLVDNAAERIPDKRAVNQLPAALVKRIILAASNPGEMVLDPFHGTGTTARAALALGRRYVGIEIDPAVAEASKRWIKAHLARPRKES